MRVNRKSINFAPLSKDSVIRIGLWCNGSTRHFGRLSLGSKPGSPTKEISAGKLLSGGDFLYPRRKVRHFLRRNKYVFAQDRHQFCAKTPAILQQIPRILQPSCTPNSWPYSFFQLTLPPYQGHKTEKMKSRFKAILLIGLCLLMQAIAVYPHHHHDDALCTAHDMRTASTSGLPQPCTAGCITHFSLTLPTTETSVTSQKDIRRHKSDATPERTVCTALLLSTGHCGQGECRTTFYVSPPADGTALRAPPVVYSSDKKE